ncbi:hypothetical protein OOJ91_32165 [Micromonospora lupini]|uniref:hypothetical protein n=1 Tax=Micromonospora lupini TaxID=285679 RepID=UPI002255B118|nr:hypothetical protein [Micromonospora lupini]MCX5070500.1 hypothetical protein [Micromonospora lupini]
MSQPPTGPEGLPPATPTPPAGSPDPDATVQHAAGADPTVQHAAGADPTVQNAAGADPTVRYPAGQPAPQQYVPGQPTPQQQYAPGHAAPQYGAAAPAQQQYGAPQTQSYPASAPPYAGQPMSAPPVSGPAYGQPMSAPPVSGPAYGQPMSAPPVSGPAYGQPMSGPPGMAPYGAAPAPRRGRAVLVLALVAALLFVVSGVMTGLFVTKNNELNRTEKRLTSQVSQRDGTIAANTTEIAKLKTDMQAMQDKLDNTEQDLTGTRNDRDEQARQKKVIASCLDKLTTALGAAAAGNRSAYNAAMKGLDKVCDEAENYL